MNKEVLMVSNLRNNCRATLTQMSKKTNIPISTLFEMLRRTDKIKKHTCIPDFSKLGYAVKALMMVKVDVNERGEFKEFALAHPNLNSFFKINNGFDYCLEMVYRGLHELEIFSDQMERKFTIKGKQIHYIIEDIAREEFLSDPKKIEVFHLV